MEARNIEGPGKVINAFSVDVEDYFQVEAFSAVVDRLSWPSRPSRVVESTQRVLSLLEAAGVRATFFVLGWVAERFPRLLGDIRSGGHEIASHGYAHELARAQTRSRFRDDVRRAKDVLENCAGVRVRGFRAPTFSIGRENWWAYDVLAEEGYEYSSSLYPISHDLYGMPEAPRIPFRPLVGSPLLEIPIATLRLLGNNLPSGGGGYFRLAPYALSRWCIRRTNRAEHVPCVFYCHPWEFDIYQPRIDGISLKARFRHYLNIGRMEHRVTRLLRDFAWGRMDEIYLGCAQPAGTKRLVEWKR
jgi:polysaccharide deacetylase family protein (PEP-CTERM system associated)